MKYWMGIGGVLVALALCVGCSSSNNSSATSTPASSSASPSAGGGSSANSLDGASFKVGSKEFTEQLVLGQIAILALQNAGAKVEDKTGITGTSNVRTALTSGDIDMYWEYTGTGWSTHLGHEVSNAPTDPQELYKQVAQEDLQKNNIVWLDPAPMNDTYALVTAADRSQSMNVSTISDYANLANSNPSDATVCAATEFLTRDDGWPGVEKAYGFSLPQSNVSEIEFSLIPSEVKKGDPCNFGEAFATDGTIAANNLVVLQDDKSYFPIYNVAMTIRKDAYDKYSDQLDAIFNPITAKLTNETMQSLNAKVDVDGMDPKDVAEQFLKDNGFIN